MKEWSYQAIQKIKADFNRSSDTHLIQVKLPFSTEIHLYLKDESTHPTGSLKHRLARSLFLYGLCNGWIEDSTTIIESSSGNTAVSEAYFAQLIGLPFIAVIPIGTSQQKVDQITFYGGKCHFVESKDIYLESKRLAQQLNGHYMDQFTYAERATDWRGNNNIAESIFEQMQLEPHPDPTWIVMSAGTGGTSSTLGRYIRYTQKKTQLCLADPENSVFYDYYYGKDVSQFSVTPSNIEGIGRPRVEPSFSPFVINHMIKVPDAASIATIRFLEKWINRKCGGSTGTNLYATCQIITEMHQHQQSGSIVTILCDAGDRYLDTYYNDDWLREKKFEISPYFQQMEQFYQTGRFNNL